MKTLATHPALVTAWLLALGGLPLPARPTLASAPRSAGPGAPVPPRPAG